MNRVSFRPDFEKWWLIFIAFAYLPAVSAYGWRVFVLGIAAVSAGHLTAIISCRLRQGPVAMEGGALWLMLPLALPPAVPWWVPAVGAVFGELVARQMFGGYGRNLVNPLAAAVVFLGTGYPRIVSQADLLLAKGSILPGECSAALIALCLVLLWNRRALHAAFPLGAFLGLLLATALSHVLKPSAPFALVEQLTGGGFVIGIAAAGLDVFSLSRTPAMRFPAGVIYGMIYALLFSVSGPVLPAFAALLLVNILTPAGDALVLARRSRQWIVTDGKTA